MQMSGINYILETTYSTFVVFFYYYIIRTFVEFKPFALGFHPLTNLDEMVLVMLGIFTAVSLLKGISFFAYQMGKENELNDSNKGFLPTQRF